MRLVAIPLFAACLGVPDAHAVSGAHPPAISTWDTRSSSVVLGYQESFGLGGTLRSATYSSNFTSSSGRLSSQFALHYLAYGLDDWPSVAHGAGGSAITLHQWPLIGDLRDGPADLALAVYGGPAAALVMNGRDNLAMVPVPLGLGVPISPFHELTLTPWAEVAPTLEVISRIEEVDIQVEDGVPVDVQQTLESALGLHVGMRVPARGGVDLNVHAGRVDFAARIGLSSLIDERGARPVGSIGLGVTVHWDHPAAGAGGCPPCPGEGGA
ncbi:MAG: hypothetical protein H6734_11470 [Alphaproteobacteria bacterium]|nr:hypothetical protein [Alphaproteobacteria bacterium]